MSFLWASQKACFQKMILHHNFTKWSVAIKGKIKGEWLAIVGQWHSEECKLWQEDASRSATSPPHLSGLSHGGKASFT